MGQRKISNIMVSLEPDLKDIVQKSVDKSGMSASAYFRKLAIEKLKEEGLLTDSMLVKIMG